MCPLFDDTTNRGALLAPLLNFLRPRGPFKHQTGCSYMKKIEHSHRMQDKPWWNRHFMTYVRMVDAVERLRWPDEIERQRLAEMARVAARERRKRRKARERRAKLKAAGQAKPA